MAQFGRNIYGTSLFGKSNAFIGTYDTKLIDAGEPFEGTVNVTLNANLPSMFYSHKDSIFQYSGNNTVSNDYTTLQKDSTIDVYISGKNLELEFISGEATVEVMEQESKEKRTYTTDESGVLELENFPLKNSMQNYIITIKADSVFQFKGIRVQTTEIQGWVRGTTEAHSRSQYFLNGKWPLPFEGDEMDEHNKTWVFNEKINFAEEGNVVSGETTKWKDVRYLQLKLILLTTESKTAPKVNEISFYSGDMNKFRPSGIWQATLDMRNLAEEKGVRFDRVQKVEWVEKEEEPSQFDLHSSSRNGRTPSVLNIMDDSYWSDLTAKYSLKHNGVSYGEPYGRISLNQRNNGYSESASLGNVLFGPINTLDMGFTNTIIRNWNNLSNKIYYPRNSNSSFIDFEFYENRNDIQRGIPPVYIVSSPKANEKSLLNISNRYDRLFVRIVLRRNTSFSSPVLDEVHLTSDLKYESSASNSQFVDTLSPLDGYELNNQIGKGRRLVRNLPLDTYDWPSRSQHLSVNKENIEKTEKEVRIEYRPKYVNQVFMGLDKVDNKKIIFTDIYPSNFEVHSQVYAEEPKANTYEVDKNTLYWHYSYDGGGVNFPLTTTRDLTTQFTPSLLQRKNYRFAVENGWSNETFKVPYPMSFGEVSEITQNEEEELIELNSNIPLYDGNILTGYNILLPNRTKNNLISLRFKKTKDSITEFSILNDKENDSIEAWIEESDNFQYLNWASEERLFKGIINYNDRQIPYIRNQNSSYNVQQTGNHTVSLSSETALEVATRYNVDVEDLLIANDKKEIFYRNENVIIPGGYSLPDIEPGLIFEGDHPYVVEVVPGSVRRTEGNVRLPTSVLTPGAEDEPAISYTLTESNTETVYVRRGEVRNGRDHLPVSNVIEIHEVVNNETGERYVPSTSSMGDYKLVDSHIDWSPAFGSSKEPNSGELYRVTLTRGVVDTLRIVYTSNYTERMSQDRMLAVPILSENYKVDLREDYKVTLPSFVEMQKEYPELKNMRYVAENNDLWVSHTIEDNEITLSLNGEDPNVNWYPTVRTGFYYLNDQEYYLYSRPTETVFDDKDIPVIRNVEYTEKGLKAPAT